MRARTSKQTPNPRFRLLVTGIFLLMLLLIVAGRAFQLQILQGKKLKLLGEKQHLQEWIVSPKRGSILSRRGDALAISVDAHSIYVRPRRLESVKLVVPRLARALNMNPQEVRRRVKAKKPFVWLKRQVTPAQARRVRALKLKGVGMYQESKRYYPRGRLAGQVVGFAGRDGQGLEGLERQYDRYIRGEQGSSLVERDALGRRVLARGLDDLTIPAGADIELSLDTSLQHMAEKSLENTVKKYRAKAGSVVVMEPFTGEVLVMANYPTFDPNRFAREPKHRWRNRAITDSFEPGSTFKAILAAAALNDGIVGREDLFFCEFGRYRYGGRTIHDTKKHGWLSFTNVIRLSSNIGVTKVAHRLKKENYYSYIKGFGFGQRTHVDLPGEITGLVRSPEHWYDIDLAAHAFGQSISVTPIQMVTALAAIANGGYLMRPYVVKQVIDPGKRVVLKNKPYVVRRVISEKTARVVTEILKGVVRDGGTGARAAVPGFDVAGKTGTAQKADLVRGGYSRTKRVASFIGFAPADDPRFVMLTMIDEPKVNVYGGVVAAPLFREIATATLRHLGVVPQRDPFPRLPAGAGEKNLIRVSHGSGGPARAQHGGTTPDFIGLSMREALRVAKRLGVGVELRGHGYVTQQKVAGASETRNAERWVLTLGD